MGIRGKEKIGSTIGVYVHIPYCVNKCPYCDFKSVVSKELPEKSYIDSVVKELSAVIEKDGFKGLRPLESLYMGGGTPSLFSVSSIGRLVDSILPSFAPFKDTEITLEANPDTVDIDKLKGYRKAGVSRLSIGFQSLIDSELKALGRTHSAVKSLESYEAARSAGFANIGVDLIFGVPGQTLKTWTESLKKAVELRPEHISLYNLTLEEGTPFHSSYVRERRPGLAALPEEEEEVRMYGAAVEFLSEAGYEHYEISNWALPGYSSVHNRRYWLGKDYIGLGSSAHSYMSTPGWGRRWWNEPDPVAYMKRMEEGGAVAGGENLTRDEAMTEFIMLGLRMLDKGIDADAFKARFDVYPKEALRNWTSLEEEGLLTSRGEDLLLTPRGVLLSNEVFLRIEL